MRLWGSSSSGSLTWSLPFLRFRCPFPLRRDFLAKVLLLAIFRSEPQVMYKETNQSADHRQVSNPLERTLPQLHHDRNARIPGQPAVKFRLRRVMQYVEHARAAHARRVVNAGLRKIVVLAQLRGALLRQIFHVVFAAEVQATRRASLDARRLQPLAHAVRAQRALKHALGFRI